MFIDSKYTKIFKSNDLTQLKYNELYDFAIAIREHKNTVSEYVNKNLLKYLDYNIFSFSKEMRETYKGIVSSSFDGELYKQIFICYQNKFKAIQRNLLFEKIIFLGFEFYKRDTKKHKKGDFKKVILKRENSPLSICLSYLARYGNENIIDYINSQFDNVDDKKKKFYNNILNCINKFGFERLFSLALSKRNRIIKHYQKKIIEFKSLTFSGRCRKTDIISYNKNYNSIINSFVSLSGLNRKSFDIPIKFNKDYHGNMKDFHKCSPDYRYTITFNEKDKQVNVHICKDGKRYIPTVNENSNCIGIDVNVKHNLFSLSDGSAYDYNRKLVNDFCKLSTYLDKVKEKQEKGKKDFKYKVGRRYQLKLDKLREKMVKSNQELISNICKTLQSNGITHIVMENLDNGFGKSYIKDKNNEDINFNRVVNFLRISSLKAEFEHIGRKYDIAVSTVQSYYTSKMCPICGCIEDENRINQEDFSCIECGHSGNADINAAINIRNRVIEAVLREKLLKQMDNGAYEPKDLKKEKVKEVLLSFRRNLVKGSESRYIQH